MSQSLNVDPKVLQHLTDRTVMPKPEFLQLGDEARMRAFTIAKQTDASILQTTLDALKEAQDKGMTLWDFKEAFPEILAPYREAGREWHLDLVFNQNIRQARAVGAAQARQQTKRAFPYVEYRCGPNPRPTHKALDKKIFAVDDPFLLSHTPPWDFGCNCDLVPRTAAQVGRVQEAEQHLPPEERQLTVGNEALQGMMQRHQLPDPTPRAQGGMGAFRPVDVRPPALKGGEYSFRPDRLNQVVDLSSYDAEVRDRLMGQLRQVGYQLLADGTTVVPPIAAPAAVPGFPPIPPTTPSASRHIGRPSTSKVALPVRGGLTAGSGHVGRVTGRISTSRAHIARTGPVTSPGTFTRSAA